MQISIHHDSKQNIQIYGDEGFTIVPYRLFAIINLFIIHNGGYTFLFPAGDNI